MLDHVIAWVCSQHWAIHPSRLAVIQDLLSYRAAGGRLSPEEIAERMEPGAVFNGPKVDPRANRLPYVSHPEAFAGSGGGLPRTAGAVGVIPVRGILTQRKAVSLSEPTGASTEEIGNVYEQMVADNDIRVILFDIESPGGSAFGMETLADRLQEGRKAKRTVMVANSFAGSAAYWIFAQATKGDAVVTPGGQVGSIGVFTVHKDMSALLEREGIKMTLIHAGRLKTAGNEYQPLSEEAADRLQGITDDYYDRFTLGVARGRGVRQSTVKAGFGEGMMVLDRTALKEGMADRIGTFASELARARGSSRGRTVRAESWSQPMSQWGEPEDAAPEQAAESMIEIETTVEVSETLAEAVEEALSMGGETPEPKESEPEPEAKSEPEPEDTPEAQAIREAMAKDEAVAREQEDLGRRISITERSA